MTTQVVAPRFVSAELRTDVDGPLYVNGDDHAEEKCLSNDRVMGLAFDSLFNLYAEDEGRANQAVHG